MNETKRERTFAWGDLLLIVVALRVLRLFSRVPRSRSRKDGGAEAAGPRPLRVLARLLLLVIAFASLTGGLGWLISSSVRSSSTPDLPQAPGSVRLYFTTPGVTSRLTTRIHESDGTTFFDYTLFIEGPAAAKSIRYYVVFSGSAVPEDRYPNGDPLLRRRGCPVSVSTQLDDAVCHETTVAPDALFSDPHVREKALIMEGELVRNDVGYMFGTFGSFKRARFSTTSGKRTYFRLPSIGTTYLPLDGRQTATANVQEGGPGGAIRAFVPLRLDVSIDDGELELSSRPESISPQPISDGRLLWYEQDAASVSPSGTYVNISEEENGQKLLFFAGVALGALIPLWSSTLRALWRTAADLMARGRGAAQEP
jgi:hypothetical protein